MAPASVRTGAAAPAGRTAPGTGAAPAVMPRLGVATAVIRRDPGTPTTVGPVGAEAPAARRPATQSAVGTRPVVDFVLRIVRPTAAARQDVVTKVRPARVLCVDASAMTAAWAEQTATDDRGATIGPARARAVSGAAAPSGNCRVAVDDRLKARDRSGIGVTVTARTGSGAGALRTGPAKAGVPALATGGSHQARQAGSGDPEPAAARNRAAPTGGAVKDVTAVSGAGTSGAAGVVRPSVRIRRIGAPVAAPEAGRSATRASLAAVRKEPRTTRPSEPLAVARSRSSTRRPGARVPAEAVNWRYPRTPIRACWTQLCAQSCVR